MIDPNIMNQQLQAEGRQPNRYQRKEEVHAEEVHPSFKPPQFNIDYDEGFYDEDEEELAPAPAPTAGRPTPPPMREYRNPVHTEDEELAPGLFQSDIDSWKRQFGRVWVAEVKGSPFVCRPLQRYEYKEIISVPNTDPLMREEMICEYCVLYPIGYDFATMANQLAGVPAVLSETIMENSGFTRDVVIREL